MLLKKQADFLHAADGFRGGRLEQVTGMRHPFEHMEIGDNTLIPEFTLGTYGITQQQIPRA